MRAELVYVAHPQNSITPDEPWQVEREPLHWYNASADFALEHLGRGPGKCLVIGSPVFEAVELMDAGWDVTYLDIRKPPLIDKYVIADGSRIPFADKSFDAVSTSCVICHAGLGRYGDEVQDYADQLILREMFRVLKTGGKAAVTFGPVTGLPFPVRIGTCHRIYTVAEAHRMARHEDFKVKTFAVWDAVRSSWRAPDEEATKELTVPDYLSMLLEA